MAHRTDRAVLLLDPLMKLNRCMFCPPVLHRRRWSRCTGMRRRPRTSRRKPQAPLDQASRRTGQASLSFPKPRTSITVQYYSRLVFPMHTSTRRGIFILWNGWVLRVLECTLFSEAQGTRNHFVYSTHPEKMRFLLIFVCVFYDIAHCATAVGSPRWGF